MAAILRRIWFKMPETNPLSPGTLVFTGTAAPSPTATFRTARDRQRSDPSFLFIYLKTRLLSNEAERVHREPDFRIPSQISRCLVSPVETSAGHAYFIVSLGARNALTVYESPTSHGLS